MSEMPAGIVLSDGQSWNAQHSYVQTKGAMCDKKGLLAAYSKSGAKETLPWLKEQAAKGVVVPPYATFRLWASAKKIKTTPATPAKTSPAPTTIEAMEAVIKQQQDVLAQQKKDYVKLLLNEVTRLKAELGLATQKYEEITEGMSQTELEELHESDTL
jgi:hypothetical protein